MSQDRDRTRTNGDKYISVILLKENYEALNLNKEEYDKYLEAEIVKNLKKNEVNKGDTYPKCIKSSPDFFTFY